MVGCGDQNTILSSILIKLQISVLKSLTNFLIFCNLFYIAFMINLNGTNNLNYKL